MMGRRTGDGRVARLGAALASMAALLVLTAGLVLVPTPDTAVGQEEGSMEPATLVREAGAHDGGTVVITGEAIGDILHADEGRVWVNVLGSGGTAVGVWVERAQAEHIGVLGDWKHRGDTVRVRGAFSQACEEHGGDLDIHAHDLSVIQRGERTTRPVSWWQGALGAVLVLLAGGLQVLYRKRRVAVD